MLIMVEARHMWGYAVYGKSLYLLFAENLKLLFEKLSWRKRDCYLTQNFHF